MGQPSKERERDGGRVLGTLREEAAPASLHGHVSRVEPKQTCAVVRPAQLTVTSAGGGRCPVLPFIRAEEPSSLEGSDSGVLTMLMMVQYS